ncbi:MAG: hypothetical protein IPH24_07815 [Crocinitomicaceae bacterium]|nr:hypothetical protein [Crocinitomicaceae bacterium]
MPRVFYYPNCDTSISVFGSIELKSEKSSTGGTVDSAFYDDGTYKPRESPNPSGSIVKTNESVVNMTGDTLVKGFGGPDGSKGIIKDGTAFQPNGYNKVYDSENNIWMDGQFKSCKLWNGKLYLYNSDGILLKIEIWKNGAYHSDAWL